eukprot:PhF_6_TR13007/c0_g1_i3/m.20606
MVTYFQIVVTTTVTSTILYCMDCVFRRILPTYFHGTRESAWVLPAISILYIVSFLTDPPMNLPSIHKAVIVTCCIAFFFHLFKLRLLAALMMIIQGLGQLSWEYRNTRVGVLPAFLVIPVYYLGGTPLITSKWWGRRAFANTTETRSLALTWMYWFLSVDVSATMFGHSKEVEGCMDPLLILVQAIFFKSFIENAVSKEV